MADNTKRIEKLEHTVFGNGDIGHDEMLRQLHAWMLEQKEKQKDAEKEKKEADKIADEDRKYFRRAFTTPFIATIIMLFMNGIIFVITQWPLFVQAVLVHKP